MIKLPSLLRQRLKVSDLVKSPLPLGFHLSVLKYSTIYNVPDLASQQIGHLLRTPRWNFRYLPLGVQCVSFQTKRLVTEEGAFFWRWSSKMAVSKPACTKEIELKDEFEKTLPIIIDEILQQKYGNTDVKDAIIWLQQVMEYNIQGGKKARGLALVVTYNNICSDADPVLLEKSFILGWCIEMLQAFFLVSDDIMDQSQTRRGKECWYKKVGLGAVNDAIMLEAVIYKILKDHFKGLPCYNQIVEEFRETTWKTTLGQCLDMTSSPDGRPNWDLFTQDRYEAIVKHKTTWYTFCLPIHFAIILADWDDSVYKDLEDILIKMGYYFQVQDDYLDCFGDPLVTGKYGSDIDDGKCTWLILEALKVADDNTRKILKDNYGMSSHDNYSIVKKIYQGLDIPSRYRKFEEEIYKEILLMIEGIQPIHVKCVPVLLNILEKLHQRDK